MPSVPTLTVTDNGDGTGAVATIAGSTPGSSNAVNIQADSATTWTVAGIQPSDGTVAIAQPRGYYWAYCQSLLGPVSVVSNVVRFAITNFDDSVHDRSADAIVAKLLTLSMPLINGRIYKQMLPDENVVEFPCVIVHYNKGEQYLGGTNIRDDIGYPLSVLICDRKLTNLGTMPGWITSYRQRMQRALRNVKLVGVPEIYNVLIEPDAVVDEKLPMYQYFVSGFTVICVSREVRGA